MKKMLVIAGSITSLSALLTAVSWFTWNSSCRGIYDLLQEGSRYSGMCVGGGTQFAGVFIGSLGMSIAFLGLVALVCRLLGLRLISK